jgi:hypothetical protein
MYKTKISEDGRTLRIPVVLSIPASDEQRRLKRSEPAAGAIEGETCDYQTVENAPISALFPANWLKSLMVVKIDPQANDDDKGPHLLADISQGNDTRTHLFSSGKTHYFGSPRLKQAIAMFFRSEPDAAVRYGSLFTSNCYEGLETIGPQNPVSPDDASAVRLKVVNYKVAEDQGFRTDDCFGFCNSALAEKLGAPSDRPFQFRLIWNERWADPDQPFLPSFLSKGVLAVDDELAPEPNQIILDQTSIKGIHKEVLDTFVPRGDYALPQVVLGNRENARNRLYRNSWQFTTSFSAEAIERDFGPVTQAEAERLRVIQSDPAMLKRHVIRLYRQSQHIIDSHDEGSDTYADPDLDEGQGSEREDPVMIQLLCQDKLGILNATPKVQDYQRSRLQRAWKELAINGGHKHQSARAVPSRELTRGEVCIPGVPDGEVIIVTRSPIPSSDNIRKYVNNATVERLQLYKGCIWMNAADAAEYHQGDFDGDQMQWDFARDLPNIAKEVKWAGEPGDFKGIQQRPKQPYVITDLSVYTADRESLKQVAPIIQGSVLEGAIGGEQNKVGLVATLIGRIQSAQPNDEDRLTHETMTAFRTEKHDLLERLMGALQIEVDYGKSAERLEDVEEIGGETLLAEAQTWTEAHPVPFFDHKKDPDLYKHVMMPDTGSKSAVEVLVRITNQAWEALPVGQKPRRYFQDVLHSEEERQAALTHPLYPLVEESALAYKEAFNALVARNLKEPLTAQESAKRIGAFYQDCDAFVAQGLGIDGLSPDELEDVKELFHLALWKVCHTSETHHDKRPLEPGGEIYNWCQRQPITFGPKPLQRHKQPGLSEVDVITAPFGPKTDQMKAYLDQNNITYTAYQQAKAPLMDFVLDPSTTPSVMTHLENQYPDHRAARFEGQVHRPAAYDKWSIPRSRSGTGSLAYNVCVPQLLAAVERQQHLREGIRAMGLRHGDFKTQLPGTRANAVLRVGQFPHDHPDKSLAGQPCLMSNDKIVGAFPQGQKIPIVGTVFRAPELTLTANQQGIVNAVEGNVEQTSIYVPVQSSRETEGLADEHTPASVRAVKAARESAQSGVPYQPIKAIEPPVKVKQKTRIGQLAQASKLARPPARAKADMQMD